MGKDKQPRDNSDCPSIDEYMKMDEEEKDAAIQRAVIRLQSRIQQILYLMDSDPGSKDAHAYIKRKGGEKD